MDRQVFDVLYHELDLSLGRKVWQVLTVEALGSHEAKRKAKRILATLEREGSVRLFRTVSQVGRAGQFDGLVGKPLRFSDRAWS